MWRSLSDLGDAALVLPLAAVCAMWLTATNARLAIRWVAILAVGMSVVGTFKILYAGCGLEFARIHFRVPSGHTMLASAVWPTALMLVLPRSPPCNAAASIGGLSLGALVGIARVAQGAHALIESAIGWLIGAILTMQFASRLRAEKAPLRHHRTLAAASILIELSTAYGHHAPLQTMIERGSPWLCHALLH